MLVERLQSLPLLQSWLVAPRLVSSRVLVSLSRQRVRDLADPSGVCGSDARSFSTPSLTLRDADTKLRPKRDWPQSDQARTDFATMESNLEFIMS
jgi:hypothetical protein